MSEFKVASRYAKSLAGLAQEKGVLEEVHRDIVLFAEVCKANRNLRLLLRNPIVNRDIKLNTLRRIFTPHMHPLTISFFEISVRKSREDLLEQIAIEFHKLYNQLHNIEQAQLTTAVPLSDDLLNQLREQARHIGGKEVELQVKINPELIGGFILTVGDKQIDNSVRTQLNNLHKALTYNPYIKEL
ncbi:MAG: ATP synthase F1 subunit delta [Cytophagales bacterium]|nr:ATP synthase F1 subunit delta [Bernardetiaceae bacterium]MDW8204592.1 ATP synthase F1 subunit delta [Cytophagales bacterium]